MRNADFWSGFSFLQEDLHWISQVFVVVFLTLAANLVALFLVRRLARKLRTTRTPWDDALVEAIGKPLALLVWIVGMAFAAGIVHEETDAPIFDAVEPVRNVAVIMTIAWFLVRLVSRTERNIVREREEKGKEVDRTAIAALAKLVRLSVLITTTLVGLQTLGFNISGVLAFGGIGGLAVGLAAKDLLSNFFGGLMIYLDRPFSAGDWIRSPDREIEGTVEEVGWRLTRIRTFDKRPLYVPNAAFTTMTVENPSRMSHRRIYETIGVRYDDGGKVSGIVADVKKMLLDHPDIDTSQILMVFFNKFGPSSLDFFVYTMTRTTDWVEYHAVKQDVLLKIQDIIASHGAEIAFPTSTVHVPEEVPLRIEGSAPTPMSGGGGGGARTDAS